MSTTLPFRLTEKCFRVYEPYIAYAMRILPSSYTIDVMPDKLAPTTVEARMRDAMRSLRQFRWTTSVDMIRFDALYDDIKVNIDGKTVVISLRNTTQQTVSTVSATLDVPLEKCIPGNLLALAQLVQTGIVPCVCLRGAHLQSVRDVLAAYADVAIVERDNNVYIM